MEILYSGFREYFKDVEILDTINVAVADSFVLYNKYSWTSGHGESRLYICSVNEALDFFDDDFVNEGKLYKAFITKNDLEYYLDTAEPEYLNPQSSYRNQENMTDRFEAYKVKVNQMSDTVDFFIKPHNGENDKSRFYINGCSSNNDESKKSEYYQFLREIALPQISRISIVKVKDLSSNEIKYWFRPYIHEYSVLNQPVITNETEKQIKEDETLTEEQKFSLVKSRIGQGKFREKCFEKYGNTCIITKADQKEVLQACHIKPWIDSANNERLDKNNSILLTATMHILFDLGFISFDENYNLIYSTFLTSKMKKDIAYYVENNSFDYLKHSEHYLSYHRNHIFRL